MIQTQNVGIWKDNWLCQVPFLGLTCYKFVQNFDFICWTDKINQYFENRSWWEQWRGGQSWPWAVSFHSFWYSNYICTSSVHRQWHSYSFLEEYNIFYHADSCQENLFSGQWARWCRWWPAASPPSPAQPARSALVIFSNLISWTISHQHSHLVDFLLNRIYQRN